MAITHYTEDASLATDTVDVDDEARTMLTFAARLQIAWVRFLDELERLPETLQTDPVMVSSAALEIGRKLVPVTTYEMLATVEDYPELFDRPLEDLPQRTLREVLANTLQFFIVEHLLARFEEGKAQAVGA